MNTARWAFASLLVVLAPSLSRAVSTFGPVNPYLSWADTPSGLFLPGGPAVVSQDFESDTGPWLVGFTVDCGERIGRDYISGGGFPVTDSVDGDDGVIDGDGTSGGSWFCQSNDMVLRFSDPVGAAGFAVTDGDRRLTNVRVEFLAADSSPVAVFDPGKFLDDVYNGTTPEDTFFGAQSFDKPIQFVSIAIDAGTGFEIDHVQFQAIPEPASGLLGVLAVIGLVAARRGRALRASE